MNALQGTPEWYADRLGKVGASRVADIVARTKSGWGASRGNYAAELIAERLTGEPADRYTNAAMQWGLDVEPEAKAAYSFMTNNTITDAGFVPHPRIEMAGASPDGLIGDDGLIECKCPLTATHLETLRTGKVADKYVIQMQWQMTTTGRSWCDYVSFDPRMPEHLRLWINRIEADATRIAELEDAVVEFLREIDETIERLNARYGDGPSPVREQLEQSVIMAG